MKKIVVLLSFLLLLTGCEGTSEVVIPEIVLDGASRIILEYNQEFVDRGAHVTSGDYDITVTGEVDVKTPGSYQIDYQFTYQEKEYKVTRTVEVSMPDNVEFYLLGDEIVQIQLGDNYRDPGLYISDTTIPVTVDDDVDMGSVGTYYINFNIEVNGEVVTITRTLEILEAPTAPIKYTVDDISVNGTSIEVDITAIDPSIHYVLIRLDIYKDDVKINSNGLSNGLNELVFDSLALGEYEVRLYIEYIVGYDVLMEEIVLETVEIK